MSSQRHGPAAGICAFLLFTVVVFPVMLTVVPAAASGWARTASGGFGDSGNKAVTAMATYRGRLYAGTRNPDGCQVWSYDGVSWGQEVGQGAAGAATAPGFGDAKTNNVSSMSVYDSRLYVGVRNPTGGGRIWSYDGEDWVQEVGQGADGEPAGPGFGDVNNNDIPSMAVLDGQLLAGTYNPDGCQVWSYDGERWSRVAEKGFGDADNHAASSMAVYYSRLYVGTFNNDYASGCQVWSYDGEDWMQEVGQGAASTPIGPGFGDSNNRRAASMAVYDYGLYVGTYDSSGGSGCQVWSYDGANWTKVGNGGFGDADNLAAASMASSGLDLFVGTYNEDSGCEVWRYDGRDWYKEAGGGFTAAENAAVEAMVVEGADITAGVRNGGGCQVWRARASHTLYFAEGYTGGDFQEYLCLGNPYPGEARVSITYLFPDGTSLARLVVIPAESRLTIFVNADVGENKEVAVILESDLSIAAERPMYFTYNGEWPGGHDAMGADAPSTRWFFAEGYTGEGFAQWICVLNPGNTAAVLDFRFQTQEEGEIVKEGLVVPARSRSSFKINDILGADYQNSLELESSAPVVAERPMYFDYYGTAGHHWQGGHCVMGVTRLAQVYYFAEGTTRSGFEEWLTLQNPNPFLITVNATYQMGEGQGGPVDKGYTVAPGERHTVYVPGEVGMEKDVSVVLASTSFFMAERPVYFRYAGYGADWCGGDCIVGIRQTATESFLAEGYTGEGFHTWLCLQNPGFEEALVIITYCTQEEGALPPRTVELPAGTRRTIFVNEHAGVAYQLSIRLVSSAPIVVERPMYFDYGGGVQGGHDMAGRDGS